jgi:hypothetical protein
MTCQAAFMATGKKDGDREGELEAVMPYCKQRDPRAEISMACLPQIETRPCRGA